MGSRYFAAEIEDKVEQALRGDIKELYKEPFTNYTSKVRGGEELCSDVAARYLLKQIDRITRREAIRTVTREKYHVPRSGTTENAASNREEERIAMGMWNKTYPGFGEVMNYQVPLKSGSGDKGLGKIDLVSYQSDEEKLYLLELKRPDSKETLLRSVLEIYTYGRIADHKTLVNDKNFNRPGAKVVPAVLVYKNSVAHEEYERNSEVRRLMEELEVAFFLLDREA